MKKPKKKYKHVRRFLVPASEDRCDTVGSRIEYSLPSNFTSTWDYATSVKITDCDRAVHWDVMYNAAGIKKVKTAISILQGLLKDIERVRKLPKIKKDFEL